VIRQAVVVDLGILIAAAIGKVGETFRPRDLRSARYRDGLGEERKLFAHPKRGGKPVYLVDVPKAGCNQHAAIGQPIEKICLPRMQITLETLGKRGIRRRNSLQNEIAALLMHRGRHSSLSLGGARRGAAKND
jgi:hypothetical protein